MEKKYAEEIMIKSAHFTPTAVEQKAQILEQQIAHSLIPHLTEKGQEMISLIDHLAIKVGLLPVRIIEQIEEEANKLNAEFQPETDAQET